VRNGPGATVGMLRENLYRDQDYKLLTPRAWTALSKWYDGRTPISRKVIDITAPSSPALAEDSSVSVKKVRVIACSYCCVGSCTAGQTKLSDFVAGASTRHVAKLELELYPVLLTIRRMNKVTVLFGKKCPLTGLRCFRLGCRRVNWASSTCRCYFREWIRYSTCDLVPVSRTF
jgi:hypothetical protein